MKTLIAICVLILNSSATVIEPGTSRLFATNSESDEINTARPYSSVHIPILPKIKSGFSSIKISNHGTVGYKRLSKKFKDEWARIPTSTTVNIKKNRIYSPPVFPIPMATSNYSSRVIPVKYLLNDLSAADQVPPPIEEVAKMARYIVSTSDWLSISTISARSPTVGFPFSNLFSTADGPAGMSSGNPYMYMTALDVSVIDLQKDSRASISMSLAQGDYCRQQEYDPEDPRCARVILTGNVVKLPSNSTEEMFARSALFYRHADMQDWPKDHGWFFAKLNITNILLLDYFGGINTVPIDDYYKATPGK